MNDLMMVASIIVFIVTVALAVKFWAMANDVKAIRKKYLEKEDREAKEQSQKNGELRF